MGQFKFEAPTPERARDFLKSRSMQSESYADAIACQHALRPVTNASERTKAMLFNREQRQTYPCARCQRFAFAKPGVICFWCRGKQ